MLPWWKSIKFWESASTVIALLLVQFHVVSVLDAAKLLGAIIAVLNLFNIYPELRARGIVG